MKRSLLKVLALGFGLALTAPAIAAPQSLAATTPPASASPSPTPAPAPKGSTSGSSTGSTSKSGSTSGSTSSKAPNKVRPRVKPGRLVRDGRRCHRFRRNRALRVHVRKAPAAK
jgi:hypothetical protein